MRWSFLGKADADGLKMTGSLLDQQALSSQLRLHGSCTHFRPERQGFSTLTSDELAQIGKMNRLYRKRSSLEKALGISSYCMYFSGGPGTWLNQNRSGNSVRL
jgi:hypothetical protein